MTEKNIDLQGVKVLSVDDNPNDNGLLSKMLEGIGVLCDCVSGSGEALQKIAHEKYDIIFIDNTLTGEDGITALYRIHDTHLCDEIPVVIVTEGDAGLAKQYYLNAGFSGCMNKPIISTKLHDTVRHCLNMNMGIEEEACTRSHILVVDDDELNLLIAKRILEFCVTPRNILEITELLELKEKKSARRHIKPLLEQGRLAMTIPDKPNSKNQKYITIR